MYMSFSLFQSCHHLFLYYFFINKPCTRIWTLYTVLVYWFNPICAFLSLICFLHIIHQCSFHLFLPSMFINSLDPFLVILCSCILAHLILPFIRCSFHVFLCENLSMHAFFVPFAYTSSVSLSFFSSFLP